MALKIIMQLNLKTHGAINNINRVVLEWTYLLFVALVVVDDHVAVLDLVPVRSSKVQKQ